MYIPRYLTPHLATTSGQIDLRASHRLRAQYTRSSVPIRRKLMTTAASTAGGAYVEGIVILYGSTAVPTYWAATSDYRINDPINVLLHDDDALSMAVYLAGPRWTGAALKELLGRPADDACWELEQFTPGHRLTPQLLAWLDVRLCAARHLLATGACPEPECEDDEWLMLTETLGPLWASQLLRTPIAA